MSRTSSARADPVTWSEIAFFGGIIIALGLATAILVLLGSRAGVPEPVLQWLRHLIVAGGVLVVTWLILKRRR